MLRTVITISVAAAIITLTAVAAGLTPSASAAVHHLTAWHAILAHCHRTHACHQVPAVIRHFYGIKPGDPARIQYGSTTWTWWLHAGHVHRAAS